jgi:hypothetical protein
MMLGLGIVLLVAPERLGDFRAAAVLLGVTVGAAVLLGFWDLRRDTSGGPRRA